MSTRKAYRGEILHLLANPMDGDSDNCYQHFEDGLLLIEEGRIAECEAYNKIAPGLGDDVEIVHYRNALLVPGFVDTHIHLPQTEMIGAYGEQLLEWLDTYTFPTEEKFADPAYADEIAGVFVDELLNNGTTTALVFGSVHSQSVESFFTVAQAKKLRMICGKVMMDRNAPDSLVDCAESSYQDSRQLIEKWHGKDRLAYAVTPRFAPTSTEEQLQRAGQLMREYEGLYMQTHIAENHDEIAWVKELFPDSPHYLGVYDQFDLLGRRSVLAHGIHLADEELDRLAETRSSISFCPSSNMFLGSGLLDAKRCHRHGVQLSLGTDVGGGTSFSMLSTQGDAYKCQQLRGDRLSPLESLYLATLGGARALDLDDKIGNFERGKEADFIALDYEATPLVKLRMQNSSSVLDRLFAFSILGDDRCVRATHILGEATASH